MESINKGCIGKSSTRPCGLELARVCHSLGTPGFQAKRLAVIYQHRSSDSPHGAVSWWCVSCLMRAPALLSIFGLYGFSTSGRGCGSVVKNTRCANMRTGIRISNSPIQRAGVAAFVYSSRVVRRWKRVNRQGWLTAGSFHNMVSMKSSERIYLKGIRQDI